MSQSATLAEQPILEEIISPVHKCLLLEILSTNLPLELTVPKIDYDIYWKRCYLSRWPKKLPEKVAEINFTNSVIVETHSVTSNVSCNGSSNGGSVKSRASSAKSVSSASRSSEANGNNVKTWKEDYLEQHVEDFLENLKPEEYNAEQIKNISELCNAYVRNISLYQLVCASSTANRIPLNAILTGFQNLRELSLCFKQTYIGEKFTWNVVRVPVQDVRLLAKGLEKCRLECLRITNSDIDDEKALIILKSLVKHDSLRVLDFSHCIIGDRGTLGVSKLSMSCPLQEIILVNNNIGKKGAQSVGYALTQPTCSLRQISLRLNSLKNEGVCALFSGLISSTKVNKIDLSSCNLTSSIPNLNHILKLNTSLQSIVLSNNNLGEETGKALLEQLRSNFSIKDLDIRMCGISSELECKIKNQIKFNNLQSEQQKVLSRRSSRVGPVINFDENVIQEVETILICAQLKGGVQEDPK